MRSVLRRVPRRFLFRVAGRFGRIPTPQKWVFVVGCSNSGTTLLHTIIAAHPAVASLPREGQFCTDLLAHTRDLGIDRLWATDARFRLTEADRRPDARVLQRHWGVLLNDARRPVFVEKSPPNTVRTRWLQAHFPRAHFVGVVRDGYAVAEGIARKAGHSLDVAARQWAAANAIMLEDWPFLQHKILVRYEDLTADPAAATRQVFEFLGLEAGVLDLDALLRGRFRVHHRAEPIRNLNSESWAALSAADIGAIERAAGEMLQRLGYLRPARA